MDESIQCAECGGTEVNLSYEDHTFQYGIDADHVMLTCLLPVYHCLDDDCEYSWYNYIGEQAIQECIDKHLKSLENNN